MSALLPTGSAAIITTIASGMPVRPITPRANASTTIGIADQLEQREHDRRARPRRARRSGRARRRSAPGRAARRPGRASPGSRRRRRAAATPLAFQASPASTGRITGWITVFRTVVPSMRRMCVLPGSARCCSRARSSSTSAVSTVSSVSECRLTIVMWSARPASPKSAAASGMPTCTVLPNEAEIARTLGSAARPGACGARRRSDDVDDGEQHHRRREEGDQDARVEVREVDPRRGAKEQRRHEDVERRAREHLGRVAAAEPAALRHRPADRDHGEDREQLDEDQRRHGPAVSVRFTKKGKAGAYLAGESGADISFARVRPMSDGHPLSTPLPP